MDCRDKFPGEILPSPIFPDGRGELIDILLPGLECEIKSYFLPADLDLRGIKINKNPVECLKPQKSKDRVTNGGGGSSNGGGGSNNVSIINFPPGTVIEFPPGTLPTPPTIPPGIGSLPSPTIYPPEQLNWYLCRHEVPIPDIFHENTDSRINYYWTWLLSGVPPLEIDKKVVPYPLDLTPTDPMSRSSRGWWNSLNISFDERDARLREGTLTPYTSYSIYDSFDVIMYEQIYAQGNADAFSGAPGYFNINLTFPGTNDASIRNNNTSIEEIENRMFRRFINIPEPPEYTGYIFDSYYILHLGYFDKITQHNYTISETGRQVWYGISTFSSGMISGQILNNLRTARRWIVNGLEGYYNESQEETLTNDGDNGMKEDCCECIEAMAALMEAYLEKVEKLIYESENRQIEHANETAAQICKFFTEQLKAFDIVDDDRILRRLDELENNIWTGGSLESLNIK